MDKSELPVGYLKAGSEYYKALSALGLKPEAVLWVRDVDRHRFVLWVLWSGVEKYGPYSLTKLLFEAYRASALPQEIDPFTVIALGTSGHHGENTLGLIRSSMTRGDGNWIISRHGDVSDPIFSGKREWVIHCEQKKKKPLDVSRDWKRFQRSVASLAA